MPRQFKTLFTVRDNNYLLSETDGSQLEFRVAAFLGQDQQAIADIRNKVDVHRYTASVINAIAEKGVTKAQRQDAKSDTFKPLYGGTQGTPEQERYYNAFREKYPEIYQAQGHWVDEVISSGVLVLPWGMRFYWDFYLNSKTGIAFDKRSHKPIGPSVFNYPVQSLGTAEIIPIALIYLYYRCKQSGLRVVFVNTVHDSIIAEVHQEDFNQYKQLAIKAFTNDVYRYLQRVYGLAFNVPLGCEITWGSHWSEGEAESIDREPPKTMRQ